MTKTTEAPSTEAAELTFAQKLEAMLWPERFPPGLPQHDRPHQFWDGHEALHEPDEDEDDEQAGESKAAEPVDYGCFEWSSETIEWVAEAIERQRAIEKASAK